MLEIEPCPSIMYRRKIQKWHIVRKHVVRLLQLASAFQVDLAVVVYLCHEFEFEWNRKGHANSLESKRLVSKNQGSNLEQHKGFLNIGRRQ